MGRYIRANQSVYKICNVYLNKSLYKHRFCYTYMSHIYGEIAENNRNPSQRSHNNNKKKKSNHNHTVCQRVAIITKRNVGRCVVSEYRACVCIKTAHNLNAIPSKPVWYVWIGFCRLKFGFGIPATTRLHNCVLFCRVTGGMLLNSKMIGTSMFRMSCHV